MNPDWLSFLLSRGAKLADGVVQDFGDAESERDAASGGSVIADLSQYGLLAVTGADAKGFLQGQLTCDVEALSDDTAVHGAYCTAKGRVLANFLLWPDAGTVLMLMPRSLVASIRKRLQSFVLRSKVALDDRSEAFALFGLAGPGAPTTVAAFAGAAPADHLRITRSDGVIVIALDTDRVVVVTRVERAFETWDSFASTLKPVGAPCWEWLDIANGLPWITAATQDQFVPQMANLDLIGAVNFRKGCYTGQEIVARMQYLGKPKRRLFLAQVDVESSPAPGEPLVTDGDQPAGTVVNAAPAPQGGFDLLAVVQTASAGAATVRLGSSGGPALRFRPLPYAVS